MKALAVVGVAVSSLFLSACISMQPMALPEGTAANKNITVVSRPPVGGEILTTYIVPESNFGVTTNKTGSLAVGVMLGPLGVAANAAYVAEMAKEAAGSFNGLLPKDIPGQLKDALSTKHPEYRFQVGAGDPANGIRLVPSVNLAVIDDQVVTPTCTLHVAEMKDQRAVWAGYYRAEFVRTFNKDDKAYLTGELGNASAACLSLAFSAYRRHADNQFKPARVVYANGNEADAMIHVDNENSVYFINDVIGVNVVKQSAIKIKPAL